MFFSRTLERRLTNLEKLVYEELVISKQRQHKHTFQVDRLYDVLNTLMAQLGYQWRVKDPEPEMIIVEKREKK